ncbi:beta-lactamase/transpeptidase-like protein [Lepidopterella palustris CBS 459.81]|uniref:Beta-lactamase/transpeptidase-like protein n=1 Tax=Lepidopterella palustris CBS 459.81 TaxID=1314670 RepID=A0A8E2E6I9_9PEZI|nr:beta-lactamase/transpeptidase-like protein [Lepidopterella palustris CBS 459.81]
MCISTSTWALVAICYNPSPAFPPPDLKSDDPILCKAFASINAALLIAIASPEYSTAAYSIEVTSSKESLWSAHHTAQDRNKSRPSVDRVDGDSLYRIASITKTFTVLGILYQHAAGNLSLDDSVDTYVAELQGKQNGSIPWKDITLRSLASQLSGIPREFAQSDLMNEIGDPTDFGLPPVSREGLLKCDEYADNYDPPYLLASIRNQKPLFAPNQKSTYSNIAFELLGLVLENVTSQSYSSYMTSSIFSPLSMTLTTLETPPDKYGVIPKGPHYWDVDEGVQSPTGGIYSSSSDMSKYLRYILTHYNGINHALNWFHPVSYAEGLNSFYGMPWEILRTSRILSTKKPVTFVTKSGGLPGYVSRIFMLPEYDIGITILVAGSGGSLVSRIGEIVTVELVRAAESIALRQLSERYAGNYSSTKQSLNSLITLKVDKNGLYISQLISNSTDVLTSGLPYLAGAPVDGKWHAVLVPTLLSRNNTVSHGAFWRILIAPDRPEGEAEMVWDDFCITNIDAVTYAGKPINEVVIRGCETGESCEEVELSGFRVVLKREGGSGIPREVEGEQSPIELR